MTDKVDPNVTSDCGDYTGAKALDGLSRDIVVVARRLDGHKPLELFFDGTRFDFGFSCDLTGADTYVDTSDLKDTHDGS